MKNTTDKISVLYLDDEENNLISFKALLRLEYNIFLAGTAEKAVDILNSHPEIEVIISDQRMPVKTGTEFFEEIGKSHPLPVRMLLTAYTDIDAVVEAINRGRVFRYITKPWNNFELTSAIREAYQFYISNSLLKKKNDELQAAYDELDRFSHSVTHDIRGPIVSAINALDQLKDVTDVDEIRNFMKLMEKSMKYLNSYIMSSHSYHRTNQGQLEISDVNFNDLVASMIEMYEVEKRTKDMDLEVVINQHFPFRSDEVLLCMIIDNLLSNAFKYANSNNARHKVVLTIQVAKESAVISINDNGVGIDKSHVSRIFELFYRGDGAAVAEGSGFGLYNVNAAVQKLGGNIEVASVPGDGSTFVVTLPQRH